MEPMLTFLSFGSLMAIGQAVKFNSVDGYKDRSFQLISWRAFFCALLVVASMFVRPLIPASHNIQRILATVEIGFPAALIVVFAKHRLHAALSAFLITIFFLIIALLPMGYVGHG